MNGWFPSPPFLVLFCLFPHSNEDNPSKAWSSLPHAVNNRLCEWTVDEREFYETWSFDVRFCIPFPRPWTTCTCVCLVNKQDCGGCFIHPRRTSHNRTSAPIPSSTHFHIFLFRSFENTRLRPTENALVGHPCYTMDFVFTHTTAWHSWTNHWTWVFFPSHCSQKRCWEMLIERRRKVKSRIRKVKSMEFLFF